MVAFGYGVTQLGGLAGSPWLHGLKIVAVAVVAQAVWGMARSLCPDRERQAIMAVAAVLTLAVPSSLGQIGAIIAGALIGWRALPGEVIALTPLPVRISRWWSIASIVLFVALLVGLPFAAVSTGSHGVAVFEAFYRSGSLVFGGGHVVLPLLQASTVQTGWVGGLFCLVGIFLPSFFLAIGPLPFWDWIRRHPGMRSVLKGVNAAVVGLLLAALYNPVWTSAIHAPMDFAIALIAFLLLSFWKTPPWLVVFLGAAGAAAIAAV
jgi:chromate transporter